MTGADDKESVQTVGRLLVNRVKMTQTKAASSGTVPDTPPKSKKINAGVEDCVELCRLLLQKVGAESSINDSAELDRLLTTEYPPGVADILGRITGALDINNVLDSVSDVTGSTTDGEQTSSDVPTNPKIIKKDSLPSPALIPDSQYNSNTEIAISRIFEIGKFKSVTDPSIPATAPYTGPDVVSMTGFGELGRFGNQVLQYAFLKSYSTLHNIPNIQVPPWVGSGLFGLNDAPVARALPPVVEFQGTLANSTFTDDLIKYVKNSDISGNTAELSTECLNPTNAGTGPRNVDIWGWFQWHSSVYAPFKETIQETFSPVSAMDVNLHEIFDREVRHAGGRRRTVVGIHLRYGDYQSIAASSFGYCAPTVWYLQWLAGIWPTLDDPVLIVTSDDLAAVLNDFAAYNPVTTSSVGMRLPAEFKGLKAGFFPDWYALTKCDVMAISNSTFSFSAAMMNNQPNLRVFRAHYARQMVEIDPWDAEPIVHREVNQSGLAHAIETLQILYDTQGTKAVLRNLAFELPYYGMRSIVMKVVLWREARNKAQAVANA